jgi:tyrosine-protein kinase Etk/Wzc
MSEQSPHQVNLLDFFAFMLRWRIFLLTTVLAVAIFVGIISFTLTPKYRSTALVRSQENSGTGLGGLLASKLGAMAGIGNLMGFAAVPEESFVAILKSRWMSEHVIEKFDLRSVYKMKNEKLEDVIRSLQANSRFELDPESGTLWIYADDTDPVRSRDIVQYYVDELDQRNQEIKSTGARREREFIGQRLIEERIKLSVLEDSLSQFQSTTGILDPVEQVKATLHAGAELEALRIATRTELEMNNLVRGPNNSENELLKMKLMSLDSSLQSLIHGNSDNPESEILIKLTGAPQQGMIFVRLKRNIEIQQMLVGFLLQQYEQARIEEQRNTPTIMRLDPPMIASGRIWPRRGMMVIIASVVAFVFATSLALIIDFFRRASSNPAHPQYDRIVRIRQAWSKKTDAI